MGAEQEKAFQKYLESLRALDGARSQLGAASKLYLDDQITREEFASYARKEQEAERARDLAERTYRHPGEV